MFKNYLKIAVRSLLKNKLSTFINLVGLSTAVGCSVVVFLFFDNQIGRDAFHVNAKTVFLIESLVEREGRPQLWGFTPAPLGPALATDFPQVKRAVRVGEGKGVMRYQDKVFDEFILFAESGFFDMLTFPLRYGNPLALADKKSIFLSEELAHKYFGEENPVGRQVTMRWREDWVEAFVIAGVAEKFPRKASFAFDVLMPYEVFTALTNADPQDWRTTTYGTFVQVNRPEDIGLLREKMNKYIERNNLARPDWAVSAYVFDNLLELSRNAWKVRGGIGWGDPPQAIILLVIGVLVLLLACFNYVNVAIAAAGDRLNEIGTRKVIGGKRGQIVLQFLSESVLLSMLALIVGTALAQTLFVPGFNHMFFWMNLSVDFFSNARLWLFFLGLLFFTGICAGAYPAFYVSRFQPVAIFRGKQKLGSRNRFSKLLLTFQFVLSALLITLGIVFAQNTAYQNRIDLGYNVANALTVPLDNEKQFIILGDEIIKQPEVVRVTGARTHVGPHLERKIVTRLDKKYEAISFQVGYDYLEAMQFHLQAGRTFDKNLRTDLGSALVVNRSFVRTMGWQEAIGQSVSCDSIDWTVIGVVEDFHYDDFRSKIGPVMFRLCQEANFKYLIVQTASGKNAQVAEFLKSTWRVLIPDLPYKGFSHELLLTDIHKQGEDIRAFIAAIAMIALVLSCMGLFGLVSLHVARRRKEFSIRKVLGADLFHIARLINRDFAFILAAALIVAIPLSYVLLSRLLDMAYAYHVTLTALPFALAALLIFLTAEMTVAARIYQVAKTNPVEGLRSE